MIQKANLVTLLASPLGEEGHKVAKGVQANWIHRGAPRPANPVRRHPAKSVRTVVILIMILDVDVTAEGGIIKLIAREGNPPPFEPFEPSEPYEPSRRRRVQWRQPPPQPSGQRPVKLKNPPAVGRSILRTFSVTAPLYNLRREARPTFPLNPPQSGLSIIT